MRGALRPAAALDPQRGGGRVLAGGNALRIRIALGLAALVAVVVASNGDAAGLQHGAFKVKCCFKVKIDAQGEYLLSFDNTKARGYYRVRWGWSARSIDWLYDVLGQSLLLATPPQPGASSRTVLGGQFHESNNLEYNREQPPNAPKWEADLPKCDDGEGTFENADLAKATHSDSGSIRPGIDGAVVHARELDVWRERCHGAATTAGFATFPATHFQFSALSPPPLARLRAGNTGKGWLTTTCTRTVYKTVQGAERKAFFIVRVQIQYIRPAQLQAATNTLRKQAGDTFLGAQADGVLDDFVDVFYGDGGLPGPWPPRLPSDGCHKP